MFQSKQPKLAGAVRSAVALRTYVIWLLVLVQGNVLADQDTDADARQIKAIQKLQARARCWSSP
jgi:hypothetical protein